MPDALLAVTIAAPEEPAFPAPLPVALPAGLIVTVLPMVPAVLLLGFVPAAAVVAALLALEGLEVAPVRIVAVEGLCAWAEDSDFDAISDFEQPPEQEVRVLVSVEVSWIVVVVVLDEEAAWAPTALEATEPEPAEEDWATAFLAISADEDASTLFDDEPERPTGVVSLANIPAH
jgi:hypothetical protein